MRSDSPVVVSLPFRGTFMRFSRLLSDFTVSAWVNRSGAAVSGPDEGIAANGRIVDPWWARGKQRINKIASASTDFGLRQRPKHFVASPKQICCNQQLVKGSHRPRR